MADETTFRILFCLFAYVMLTCLGFIYVSMEPQTLTSDLYLRSTGDMGVSGIHTVDDAIVDLENELRQMNKTRNIQRSPTGVLEGLVKGHYELVKQKRLRIALSRLPQDTDTDFIPQKKNSSRHKTDNPDNRLSTRKEDKKRKPGRTSGAVSKVKDGDKKGNQENREKKLSRDVGQSKNAIRGQNSTNGTKTRQKLPTDVAGDVRKDIRRFTNKAKSRLKSKDPADRERVRLLCEWKKQVQIQTMTYKDAVRYEMPHADLVPNITFREALGKEFTTCAVVSNAGSLLNSSLGAEIDAHNAILRFNHAPTVPFQSDVGRKTTIRLSNHLVQHTMLKPNVQVFEKPWGCKGLPVSTFWTYRNTKRKEFDDPENMQLCYRDYKNAAMIAWTKLDEGGDIGKWYNKIRKAGLYPRFWKQRKPQTPKQNLYLTSPEYILKQRAFLQNNTRGNETSKVTSTGFNGIHLMLSLCKMVDVYEYIPSKRRTPLCHYFDKIHNDACTTGEVVHPLTSEKDLISRMNLGTREDVYERGRVTLPGFSELHCD